MSVLCRNEAHEIKAIELGFYIDSLKFIDLLIQYVVTKHLLYAWPRELIERKIGTIPA